MKKFSIVLCALLGLSIPEVTANYHYAAPEMKGLWEAWKQINGKVYTEGEDLTRFGTFVENYITVTEYNAKENGVRLALNQFADLTQEEFKAQYLNPVPKERKVQEKGFLHIDYSVLGLPDSFDWRNKGAVTPVKNQARCGSCWAFSAVGALEGLHFLKSGKLLNFSEQQLVDCETSSAGCGGGDMPPAFDYSAKHGMELEQDYPYKAVNQKCAYDATKAHKINTGYKRVDQSPEALKAAIVTQPIAVSVQADQPAFRFYKSGAIKSDCGDALNHGIVAVGYDKTEKDGEFFIIKNSWADTWGDKGYVRISTDPKPNGGGGACGILEDNSYPTV